MALNLNAWNTWYAQGKLRITRWSLHITAMLRRKQLMQTGHVACGNVVGHCGALQSFITGTGESTLSPFLIVSNMACRVLTTRVKNCYLYFHLTTPAMGCTGVGRISRPGSTCGFENEPS